MSARTKTMGLKERNQGEQNKSSSNGTKKSSGDRKHFGFIGKVLQIDEKWTARFAVCANKDSKLSLFRPLMKMLEISCHGIPWLFFTILFLLSVHQARHVEILTNLFYGLILDLIVIVVLKLTFRRSRPVHNEGDMFATVSVDNYSFPSGHASRAGMLFCFFIFQVVTSIKWVTLVTAWSVAVSLSRVILGRHHVIDIVCGFIVGIGEYLLLIYLWIPTETCMSWLELYFSHFHL